ncbi:MAG: TIM44-related membrane protein TimA, partial [Caulobacteraceae bacterium]|nr:TIM44-related membrane protein TimA [Caulobacteraceae bacterium]
MLLTENPPIWMIIALAVGAAFVLFMLYSVLGRRVGRQPGEDPEPQLDRFRPPVPEGEPARAPRLELGDAAPGAAALRARDPQFDPAEFLEGARTAYATIVRAFAAADRAALKPLLAPAVMSSFETVMDAREGEGRSQSVEFLHPPRADLEGLELTGDVARARVRFLGELRTRSKGPEGEAVDDRRTAEIWTFERTVTA